MMSHWNSAQPQKLQNSDWLPEVLDAIGAPVLVLDAAGRIVTMNRACERATGLALAGCKSSPVWEALAPRGDARGIEEAVREAARGVTTRLETESGGRAIFWSNAPILDEAGTAQYIVWTGEDITASRQTEAGLRYANEALRDVIETSPLAIVGMYLDGTVNSWNRSAEQMFGWTAEEVVGKQFPIVPEEDEAFFRGNLERIQDGETLSGVERQRRRKDGTVISVALWNSPQRDATGRIVGAVSVIADMTERKRLEEQFRQSQKMEAVGRLAGGIAHDFNNLLTVITGYTQMVLDEIESEHPLRANVEEVLRAAESAAALTNQLLAFSRRQIMQPSVVDLNELVVTMDKMLHRMIGEDIELETQLSPQLPKVKADPGQFQQVVMNLVVNGRDAMPAGGRIRIETGFVEIEAGSTPVPALAPGLYVTLAVSDTGKGMDEETRRRLFEPFFTTKAKGKGTGLGLSTVYGIVKQAGGEISVESTPGAGTTFRIYLPAIAQAVAATANVGRCVARRAGTETVLVAEDEAGLGKLIRDVLEMAGYTVLLAGCPEEAIRAATEHRGPIHLFLSDVIMPRMSGRELAARVASLRSRAKVLYMSGYTETEILPHGIHESAVPFLQKPFTPEMLLNKVREVLDGRA